jgi:hypothetical protein
MAKLEDKVSAALAILSPRPEMLDRVRDEIETAIIEIDRLSIDKETSRAFSKTARQRIGSLMSALRRADRYANELSALHVEGDILLMKLKTVLPEYIELCEYWLAQSSKSSGRPELYKQQLAVAHARGLISTFGDPNGLALTRGNAWHQLAAVLYGDPTTDLFNQMRLISLARG